MSKRLHSLKEKHQSVGDVRGIGLFWALELVKNRRTREPFNTREKKLAGTPLLVDLVASECMKNAVYVATWINNLIIAPPLIISKEDIDTGAEALEKSLQIADREVIS